ncbi:hypothetical protein NDU88_003577 [Pleurodeles waltl]|uniref:Uncharacterized protein n=1 Tax=Pleurodeles waltl TaxID=8319 RepID=A0AAV7RFQ0_PLEWA|nr:hypothetical protein NDU88_003577 [Pleurodeles waltl]
MDYNGRSHALTGRQRENNQGSEEEPSLDPREEAAPRAYREAEEEGENNLDHCKDEKDGDDGDMVRGLVDATSWSSTAHHNSGEMWLVQGLGRGYK